MALDKIRLDLFTSIGSWSAGFYERQPFVPGESKVNYSKEIFDGAELRNLLDCALSGHIAGGKWTVEFESKMRAFFGARDFVFVNSGSSANLLMIATLCSREVGEHLNPGDEVVTTALGFPTTLAPIVQHGLIPVFVDVQAETYNPDIKQILMAIGPKTRAVFLAHPLGFSFDVAAVADACAARNIWLLEDGCDALGSEFGGRKVGTFGVMSSLSFFPAHHMTTGEGGGVVINSPKVAKSAQSIANWGKDCWCQPGDSDTCGQRFGWQLGDMPFGWDHKYLFSNIGYNLKPTDLQAAIGCAQADKINFIVERRRHNFWRFYAKLLPYSGVLSLAEIHPAANPSPYAFPILVKPESGATRDQVIKRLEAAKIETRPIFGGNLLRQPAFRDIPHRAVGSLENTDRIMRDGFFVGVHPYLDDTAIDYVGDRIIEAVNQ